MDSEKAAWLAKTNETALEPDLVICDPHHHLWRHPNDTYELAELHADTGAGHNVVSTVFVECMSGYLTDGPEAMRPVGETRYVAAMAEASAQGSGAHIAGIVSFADLSLGAAVEEVLAAHDEAGGGRFRGIRHATSWDASDRVHNAHTNPSEGEMGSPAFNEGLAVLGRMGFSFDAWMYHPQLAQLVTLAQAHPDVPIVLDHIGAPLGVGPYAGRRQEIRAEWRPLIEAVAACPNVSLKVGGIGMPLYGLGFHKLDAPPSSEMIAAAWGEDLTLCIDLFGVERCMFESNFPVDRQGCSYVVLWNAFKRVAAAMGASDSDKAWLFHDAAAHFYRL